MRYPRSLLRPIDQQGHTICAAKPRWQIAKGQSDITRFLHNTIVISSCVFIEMRRYLPWNAKDPIGEKSKVLKRSEAREALKGGFEEGV